MDKVSNNTQTTDDATHMENLARKLFSLVPTTNKLRMSKSGKSINCFNPIAGFNVKEVEVLALKAGFDNVILKPAGSSYEDERGDVQTSAEPLLIVGEDTTAITTIEGAVSAMMQIKQNSQSS
tara:strand:- start:260 stop:628 length:369 start_codon:yes stop_codon:yes gene_type:complete